MTATATEVPIEALELADLQAKVAIMQAVAGADAAMFTGEIEFQRYLGRIEMAREIGDVIAARVAELTRRP